MLAGVFALVAILHHGALFLAWRTDGDVRARSLDAAARLFPATLALWLLATLRHGPHRAADGRRTSPPGRSPGSPPLLFLGGLAGSWFARRAGRDLAAFLGSCAFLLGLLAATAAALFPTMIRATTTAASLTALNSAAARESLRAGLLWWPFGFVLAALYYVILFRLHRGKAQAAAEGEGY